jgi:hypothetical protein
MYLLFAVVVFILACVMQQHAAKEITPGHYAIFIVACVLPYLNVLLFLFCLGYAYQVRYDLIRIIKEKLG